MEIHNDVLFETGVIFSSGKLGEEEQTPATILALDQIKAESALQNELAAIQDDIKLLLLDLDKEHKRSRMLKQTKDGGLEKLDAITQRQQWVDFYLRGNANVPRPTLACTPQLRKVESLDRKVRAKSESIRSKRSALEAKERLLREVELGIPAPDPSAVPRSSEYFRSWNSRVQRELQRWQTPSTPASLASNLYHWNEILPQSS
jgi:hypothetical protein